MSHSRRPASQHSRSSTPGLGTLAIALSLLIAGDVIAGPWHGGSQQPPPQDPPGNPHGPNQQPGPPVAPPPGGKPYNPAGPENGGGAAPTGGSSERAKAGGSSATGAPGAQARSAGGQMARGVTGSATFDPTATMPDTWEQWWHDNQDRFLDLRSHLLFRGPSSARRGPLTNQGRQETDSTRRATDTVVTNDILPVLFEQLGHTNQPEILDSALIALGRCAPEEEADRLLMAAKPLLAHDVLSVQTSAVLALGIHGSPRYVPLLGALMADTTSGRAAVGGGMVPTPVRALAALSLGLGNHPAGVPLLADLVENLPDAERDLKVCAITALGLTRNEAGNEALGVLLTLLKDKRLDSPLKAHVPVAIARLDDGSHAEAVPALLGTFANEDTDDVVRAACAEALGRLASAGDAGAIELLVQSAKDANHERTRHAALMALAEIGRRDLPEEAMHKALHERLALVLVTALDDATAQTDRAWAALAIGVYAHDGASQAPQMMEHLEGTWRVQTDPSPRGACALALGLCGATEVAPEILADFRKTGDPALRGYSAVALGLLDVQEALDEMLTLCTNKASSPLLREQVAVGLALLGRSEVVGALIGVLEEVEVHSVSTSVARALGRIGDREAIEPLARIAAASDRQASTRGMACVALGLLGERGALPWNALLKETRLDEARVPALDLVLDIL